MANTLSIGETANIRVIATTNFAVAMTRAFDGGVYAKTTANTDSPDGKKHYDLRHYFVADDSSYIYTQDKSVHTPVEGTIYFPQTEYTIMEAGKKLEGMTGSFRSWGAINNGKGVGVLRFECPLGRR
ncbi:hypothetical protein AVDCRST_MAG94-6382 [uncultured Leptolyngbya sp.]|uniref:Uncharacterized protein n=2 Tax=Cyanophyceae TaxID=3028117 RepID=A0A6J4P9Q3_9CYAN|nr:hypothetical protein AVDCRST_MAG94-6382 [uncultured Leptolyngbya sp.]CAA9588812.1 hypothetical protein AVDCRST_MAG81-4497 [uncultured Synechococcales cyanobacterium]